MDLEFEHRPVLLKEVLRILMPFPGGTYVDGTLGGGGHSAEILRTAPGSRIIGIDRDERALEAAASRLKSFGDCTTVFHGNYAEMDQFVARSGIQEVDGVLLDLGVSSPQLDEGERGFSYRSDAPLDMRMDRSQPLTARDLANGLSEDELAGIIFDYGEERFARRIAARIAKERALAPIETTGRLAEIVRQAIPAPARRTGPHPSRRTFQALRIAVNDELGSLGRGLRSAVKILRPGGRLAVISFHSLEDRICKETFQELARKCQCPPGIPICVCASRPALRVLTKKPITAEEDELESNPRSRSAKLRAAERLDQG